MIKEFWQERKKEKLEQKQLRKQNKKLPRSKEERAYKVFGFLFAMFLIFGSIFYTCKQTRGIENYSWDSLIGISDEMKVKLSTPIERSKLITNKELSTIDWSTCRDKIATAGLDIVLNEKIDFIKLATEDCKLQSNLSLKQNLFGALASELIESDDIDNEVELIEVVFFQDGTELMMKSLMNVSLSSVVVSSTLPKVYLLTTSRLDIQYNKLYCLDTTLQINDFNAEENAEIIDVLKKTSLVGLDYMSNELIARQINSFAKYIKANIGIKGLNIEFLPKNN